MSRIRRALSPRLKRYLIELGWIFAFVMAWVSLGALLVVDRGLTPAEERARTGALFFIVGGAALSLRHALTSPEFKASWPRWWRPVGILWAGVLGLAGGLICVI